MAIGKQAFGACRSLGAQSNAPDDKNIKRHREKILLK
jgi:hypothetical protein